jgi:predicted hotdog family 3-hydroxylacyl-ACP dehydratase
MTTSSSICPHKYKGADILQLIPQRNPFVMVDEFEARDAPTSKESLTGASCATSLFVHIDNYFMLPNGELSESGLVEHIAQSASALAGHVAIEQGAAHPPVGMIAELKHFNCLRRPHAGEEITTLVTMGFSFGAMTLAHGISSIGDDIICEVDLKIFIQ